MANIKYMVGWCDKCHHETKQIRIECTDSMGERIFENIITLGLTSLVGFRQYKCECTRCGSINTLSK